jgi:hypothetical protein
MELSFPFWLSSAMESFFVPTGFPLLAALFFSDFLSLSASDLYMARYTVGRTG